MTNDPTNDNPLADNTAGMDSIYKPFLVRGEGGEEIDLVGELQQLVRRMSPVTPGTSPWTKSACQGLLSRAVPFWFGTKNQNHRGKIDLLDIADVAKMVVRERHQPHAVQVMFFTVPPGTWEGRADVAAGYVVYTAMSSRTKTYPDGTVRTFSDDCKWDGLMGYRLFSDREECQRVRDRAKLLIAKYHQAVEEREMSRIEWEVDQTEDRVWDFEANADEALARATAVDVELRPVREQRADPTPDSFEKILADAARMRAAARGPADADAPDERELARAEAEAGEVWYDAEAAQAEYDHESGEAYEGLSPEETRIFLDVGNDAWEMSQPD